MRICYLMGAMKQEYPPEKTAEDLVIAVDGGYEQVRQWGLVADKVIGDFDSLGFVPQEDNVDVLPVRKDETDMEYAMKLGLKEGYSRFLIQGGLGGRFDHSMANVQLLLALANEGAMGILVGEEQSMTVIRDRSLKFSPEHQGVFSVIALESQAKGVTLEGLSFEVENVTLSSAVPIGVSNEFISGKSAKITVKEGALLLIWEGIASDAACRRLLFGDKNR